MKLCLKCQQQLHSLESWHCPACGFQPECVEDTIVFAPHLSGANKSYNPKWYAELIKLESNNFWFKARNQLIEWLAKTKLHPSQSSKEITRYLEVGCGSGFVLQMLCNSFPQWQTVATEAQLEGIGLARSRVQSNTIFYQMDACAIPFKDSFDVVGAYDVIEHIEDDIAAIGQIYNALAPGGTFIVTVPQHMFLWSAYDELGGHCRRYLPGQLETLLKNTGFKVVFSSSFNSLLLPLMVVSRWMKNTQQKQDSDLLDELRLPGWVNTPLSILLSLEVALVKIGLRFPVGGSRVVVAQKPLAMPD